MIAFGQSCGPGKRLSLDRLSITYTQFFGCFLSNSLGLVIN